MGFFDDSVLPKAQGVEAERFGRSAARCAWLRSSHNFLMAARIMAALGRVSSICWPSMGRCGRSARGGTKLRRRTPAG